MKQATGKTGALKELERCLAVFTRKGTQRKLACLQELEHSRLPSSADVLRLHEALCFLRAYPDDRALLALVVRMLERFDDRADLRRHRAELADTGVAGTDIHFSFFHPQASWLAKRHGAALRIDWKAFEGKERLRGWLEAMMHEALVSQNACCSGAAAAAVECGRQLGAAAGELLVHSLSSDSPHGGGDSFVGYAAIVF